MNSVYLKTDNKKVKKAYYTAISDIVANIQPFYSSFENKELPVVMAGMGYVSPWTRDASINTINAVGYLFPEVARNTMLSMLEERDGKPYIGGEYWDAIIWVWGAWKLYTYTGNKAFLKEAYETSVNSIGYFEENEFDDTDNLFRGAACYGDGISAYPDIYAEPMDSGIMAFAKECRDKCADKGVGIPMKTLSTNCLYYYAYILADRMAMELGKAQMYADKAQKMKAAINNKFWNEEKGYYNYIIDPFGGCCSFEGMGNSFAILFDVADEAKKQSILKNAPLTANGIACVYPSFERYKNGYGRHSGTVWPHIQAFWADAAAKNNRFDLAVNEFMRLTDFACRDGYFAEIYNPDTGEVYGGIQECNEKGVCEWVSEKKQTWSATGYLHILFADILGIRMEKDGIYICPRLPKEIGCIEIEGIVLRDLTLNISVSADKTAEASAFIPYDGEKEKNIILCGMRQ